MADITGAEIPYDMPHNAVVIVEIMAKNQVITTSVVLGETGSLINSLHAVGPTVSKQGARISYTVYSHVL